MLHSRDSPVKLRDPAPGVFQPVPGHLQHLKNKVKQDLRLLLTPSGSHSCFLHGVVLCSPEQQDLIRAKQEGSPD